MGDTVRQRPEGTRGSGMVTLRQEEKNKRHTKEVLFIDERISLNLSAGFEINKGISEGVNTVSEQSPSMTRKFHHHRTGMRVILGQIITLKAKR